MMDNDFNQHISIDCVIFGYNYKQLEVLLLKRQLQGKGGKSLLINDLTLPGNHIKDNEELINAANRVLYELTGLNDIFLEEFGVFSDVDRLSKPIDQKWLKAIGKNPKNRVISIGFYSLIPLENYEMSQNGEKVFPIWYGKDPKWYNLNEVGEMAFDHKKILQSALQLLREKIQVDPIIFELLPKKFTISQVQQLFEVILGYKLDKRNFRKKINNLDFIVPLNQKQQGVKHKPARYFIFSQEVYEQTKEKQSALFFGKKGMNNSSAKTGLEST